jgi:hypothetical protein
MRSTGRFRLHHIPRAHVTGLNWCYGASSVIAAFLAVAAAIGLFAPGIYHNTAFARAAFRGTDLVSLAIALPALIVSVAFARRGSARAQIVWLGVLAYVAYTYLYVFAFDFNRLFLLYVALLSLTVYTIVRALVAIDVQALAAGFGERAPVRSVSNFLWTIGGALGLIELMQIIPSLIKGDVPEFVVKTGHPTGVVYILDLGLVVPLFLLAGKWLRAREPWGYVAAGIVLVKGIAEGLALSSSNIFLTLDGQKGDGPLIGLWALIALGSFFMLVRHVKAMEVPEDDART